MKATKKVRIESKNVEFELCYESAYIPGSEIDGGWGGRTRADYSSKRTIKVYKDGQYKGEAERLSPMISADPEHRELIAAGVTSIIYMQDTRQRLALKGIPVTYLDEAWAELEAEADCKDVKALKAAQKGEEIAEQKAIAHKILACEQATKDTFGGKLPTAQEIKKYLKEYNDAVNEGGEGWLPDLVTEADITRAKAILAE